MNLLLYLLLGGGVGAGLGCFGSCKSGGCPLTANWRRGALYGTVLGLVFYWVADGGQNAAAMNQSTPNVQHLTAAEFASEVPQTKLPVVVDFYATWCGPCRALSPMLDGLAEQYAGRIKFVKVNVDESPKLAEQYQITGLPTLLFLQHGVTAGSVVGLVAREALIQQLEALLPTKPQPTVPRS